MRWVVVAHTARGGLGGALRHSIMAVAVAAAVVTGMVGTVGVGQQTDWHDLWGRQIRGGVIPLRRVCTVVR